jgi:hypothetical protein
MPLAAKFLNHKNGLFLGRFECFPSSSTQMTSMSFASRISHCLLKLQRRKLQWRSHQSGIGEADVFFSFALPLAFMFANYLVNLVGQFAW